jgi:two-component system cell cycle sensor histidine kinase/response regulator CckA
MTTPLRIILIEDSADDADLLLHELRRGGYTPTWERVDTAAALIEALTRQQWDVITCDYVMPHLSAEAALRTIREHDVDAPAIIVSGEVGEEVAVAVMKAGAADFVSKQKLTRLVPAIARELREADERRARLRAEEALLISAQRYRDVVETSHDLVWSVDAAGRCTFVNQAVRQVLGYTPEELVGRAFADFVNPGHGSENQMLLEGLEAGHSATGHDTEVVRKDGERIFLRSNAVILRDAQGRVTGATGTSTDVTAHKRAQEERARLIAAIEQAQDSVMITSADGTIVYVNPAFERLTGYVRAEVYGRQPRMLRSSQPGNDGPQHVCASIARREAWVGTDVQRRKDGSLYQLEVTISPVHDAAGDIINFVGIGHDVTRERQLDAQLRYAQKMEAVGRLAAGVAHEFNNQLTVIKGGAQLLVTKLSAADPVRHEVERITGAVDKTASLVHQLLTFSRQRPLDAQPLTLADLVKDIVSMLELVLGEQLTLQVAAAPDAHAILADRVLVEQALMHLVAHARDTLAPEGQPSAGSTVWVEIANVTPEEVRQHVPGADAVVPAYVRLTVRDDGPSLPPAVREHIFEPYFTATALGKGNGLGLANVFGIARQHYGHILCSAEPDHGTGFHIYWPAVSSQMLAAPAQPTATPTEPQGAAAASTLLVVEDEADVRALLVRALQQAGYRVYSAATANEALAVAASIAAPIDLLVTDVVMPGDSGATLARRLREQQPGLRVLFISGHLADPLDLATLPGAQFLPKPFGLDDLLGAVGALLAARSTT